MFGGGSLNDPNGPPGGMPSTAAAHAALASNPTLYEPLYWSKFNYSGPTNAAAAAALMSSGAIPTQAHHPPTSINFSMIDKSNPPPPPPHLSASASSTLPQTSLPQHVSQFQRPGNLLWESQQKQPRGSTSEDSTQAKETSGTPGLITRAYVTQKTFNTEVMANFLNNPCFNVISVMASRVAQKSYGSEKRFLCPPPAIMYDIREYAKLRQENSLENSKMRVSGRVVVKELPNNYMPIQSQNLCDSTTVKSLYVSDSDNIKEFRVELRLYFNESYDLGHFLSSEIKVISKPSKKKQSQKTAYLGIESGTTVALFNRLRSQNVNTRYLNVNKETESVQASSKMWGIFHIYLVNETEDDGETFTSISGSIHYGSSIKLVCAETGIALPRITIRKVDKQSVFTDCEEAVSQLHKCALSFDASSYLGLNQEEIMRMTAESNPGANPGENTIPDCCVWTIINAECSKSKFYEALGPTNYEISPVPQVADTEVVSTPGAPSEGDVSSADSFILLFKGQGFNPDLQIWFNSTPCETSFISECLLQCVIPPISSFSNNNHDLTQMYTVNIYLVRLDGVIFDTDKTFTYNVIDHDTNDPNDPLPLSII